MVYQSAFWQENPAMKKKGGGINKLNYTKTRNSAVLFIGKI